MSKVTQIMAQLESDPTFLEKLARDPQGILGSYHLSPEEKSQLEKALDKSGLLKELKSKTIGDIGMFIGNATAAGRGAGPT
jgi:hypothetical protein